MAQMKKNSYAPISAGRSIMGNFTSTDTYTGNWIAAIASAISIYGVYQNNLVLDHVGAMKIWVVSNLIFVIFFYGQCRGWWNGGLSSAVICVTYLYMLVTGLYGLVVLI
jgi:hypothetical protein